MAVKVEVFQLRDAGRVSGGRLAIPQLPAVKISKVTAAGELVIEPEVRVLFLRNRGDQLVHCRLALAEDATIASAVDEGSFELAAGEEFATALPVDVNSTTYSVDFRLV